MPAPGKQAGRIIDPEILIAALDDTHDAARRDARHALVAMGKAAVPSLIEALKSPSDQVRWEATKALCEIEDPDTVPVLIRTLEDEDFGIRWLAAKGLSEMNLKCLKPLLKVLMEKGDNDLVREGAHHVFVNLNKGELRKFVTPLLSALERPAPRVQAPVAAMHALELLEKAHKI
jgi:HEAT repeat protein